MALVDPAGRLEIVNNEFVRMLGFDYETLRTMHFSEFTHVEDREIDEALFSEIVAGKRERYEVDKRYIRKSGGQIWARDDCEPGAQSLSRFCSTVTRQAAAAPTRRPAPAPRSSARRPTRRSAPPCRRGHQRSRR